MSDPIEHGSYRSFLLEILLPQFKIMRHSIRLQMLVAGFFSLTLLTAAEGQQPFEPLQLETTQDPVLPSDPPVEAETPDRTPISLELPQDLPPSSDQPVLVNVKFAGWQGASMQPQGRSITEAVRGNWVMLDANGRFRGQVQALAGAEVSQMNLFLMHMGRLVKQTTIDATGRFSFTNVRQGAYALIGWGPNGFFAFGLNIVEFNEEATENVPPNEIQVLAYQNETSINIDWIRHFAPQVSFRVYGRYPVGEGRDDPDALYGTLGVYLNPPPAAPATSISSHDVWRTTDGRLVGRVHQFSSINGRPVDVRSTKVMLLEGDAVVGSTTTDNYGTFEFEGVPNGQFGILAAGLDGVGMIAVNVVGDQPADLEDADAAAAHAIDFTLVSSETIGWLRHYATEVAYHRNLLKPRREPETDPNGEFFLPPNGGCLENYCESRYLTFDQWLGSCQGVESGFGSGRFMEAAGAGTRRVIDRWDRAYDRAFYPGESQGGSGYYGSPGYGSGGYGYPGYGNPTNGYPGYGYPGYGYPGYGGAMPAPFQPVPMN